MQHLQPNTTLQGGKYRIERVLGQGSFGITYLASTRISMNGQLGTMEVDVKVTIKEFFMSELNSRATDGNGVENTSSTLVKNYRQKFRKEAENLAKLHHPNIVKVLEVFEENNTTYYVMEFIDGENVNDYIKRNGKLSVDESLMITKEVCSSLTYMHDHRMLHLDLKPQNMMRDLKGHIYLIDFGLAKQYNDSGEPESSTSLGLGTPGYAPIEQAQYKKDGSFPVTLDIYALGASLYKMLTGMTPPESSNVLNEGLSLSPLIQAGVNDRVIAIVEKAMAPIKKDRYQTVEALSKAVSSVSLCDDEQTVFQTVEDETTHYVGMSMEQTVSNEDKNDASQIEEKVHKITLQNKRKWLKIVITGLLGLIFLLLLCTINNIPLEIYEITGYRTGEAEDALIRNWNMSIIGLCLSIFCLMCYVLSKKKYLAFISIGGILFWVGYLFYFVNSERKAKYEQVSENVTIENKEAEHPTFYFT